MLKIFDCSNSKERPKHRNINFGPKENTVVRDLKKYAHLFNSRFINNPKRADILFTNDVFSEKIKELPQPKIKRMDGIFSLKSLMKRNTGLNNSAEISDYVIFISEFSRRSYLSLYRQPLKKCSVIKNAVDNNVFYPMKNKKSELIFSANCSNWARPEKRLNYIVFLAKNIKNKILLIGECNKKLPNNITKIGYCSSEAKINNILNRSHIFINLSYKDACPKVVCQAVAVGLPILYADSGGVSEIVQSGISITDEKTIKIETKISNLHKGKLMKAYQQIVENYKTLESKANINYKKIFRDMLSQYFNIFTQIKKEVIK